MSGLAAGGCAYGTPGARTEGPAVRPVRARDETGRGFLHSADMDHQTAVAENRAALQATIEFGLRKLGAAKWEPAPGSEAAGELALADTRADGSPWGENQPRTAYAAANLMMTGVLDNLASLHQLLASQMPAIGPTVVARSAIEIGSGVWWLMEPGIGARARVCGARATTERWLALRSRARPS